MAQQLGFELPSRTALGRDAFYESPSNALALALIDSWPNWAGGKLVLTGPVGSGKTHLAHVWAKAAGARIILAKDLQNIDVPAVCSGPVAIEDVPEIAGIPEAETALFHLHNMILAEGQSILFTGTSAVVGWGLVLPDLLSRLQGTTAAALDAPDDQLLSALLVKLLSDRQLITKPDLIPYLVGRMDRSFAAAIDLVQKLDSASIALKKPITRHLAASVLDKDSNDA